MKNDNIKNVVIGLLIVIILILSVIILLKFNNERRNNNEINNNNQGQEIVESDDVIENNSNYSEKDFIRDIKVTLIDEPNCTGGDANSSLIASIDSDGNLSISRSGGAILITPGNAKYLYREGKFACDAVDLYYITEDNKLYLVENNKLISGIDQVATKVTDSEVVEFLGLSESVETKEGYDHYFRVLLKNGEVEKIKYFSTLK